MNKQESAEARRAGLVRLYQEKGSFEAVGKLVGLSRQRVQRIVAGKPERKEKPKSEPLYCQICGRPVQGLQALRGHMAWTHNQAMPTLDRSAFLAQPTGLTPADAPVTPADPPANTGNMNQEANPVEEKHDEASCPECAKKAERLKLYEERETTMANDLKLAQDSATKLRENTDKLTEKTQELEHQLNNAPFPTLEEVLRHCESGECPTHAAAWNDVKERIVKGAYENIPDSIIEQEGLKRGFIPKSIIVPRS